MERETIELCARQYALNHVIACAVLVAVGALLALNNDRFGVTLASYSVILIFLGGIQWFMPYITIGHDYLKLGRSTVLFSEIQSIKHEKNLITLRYQQHDKEAEVKTLKVRLKPMLKEDQRLVAKRLNTAFPRHVQASS
jgi:hypothetical protein